jgi:predicted acylesterase/phospholipase RssA
MTSPASISGNPASPDAQSKTVRLECDIIMKGGITSGVVFPLAVVELARTYRFRNVGGTSAGAIAAAATAAAELGRGKPGAGFEAFEELTGWLQQTADSPPGSKMKATRKKNGSRLQALFQPQPKTKELFMIALAALEPGDPKINAGLAALKVFRPVVLLGMLPALITLVFIVIVMLVMRRTTWLEVVLGVLLCLVILLIGVLVALGRHVYSKITNDIPENNFGLCSGYRSEVGVDPTNLSLTEWLHGYLNKLAALPQDGLPLTFKDLEDQEINLLMMTTNLTHGLPYRLPLETNIFLFDPAEFKMLFPKEVVKYLCDQGELDALERTNVELRRKGLDALDPTRENRARYRQEIQKGKFVQPLPSGNHLPVVVAVRMSLSFPILLSAIPLYAIDNWKRSAEYKRLCKEQGAGLEVEDANGKAIPPKPERCWFSDGGITSNFPLHFFDSPLPQRPAFAINLAPFPERKRKNNNPKQQIDNVFLPKKNNEGLWPLWTRFDGSIAKPNPSGWDKLIGFAGAIFAAAQNWADNSQLLMPGYRDRIASVYLDDGEGGLNLNMPEATLTSLSERGKAAAQQLAKQMTGKDPESDLTWDNHRWIRYRSTMAALETYLFNLETTFSGAPKNNGLSFVDLINRGLNDPPKSYQLGVVKTEDKDINQVAFADTITRQLVGLIQQWRAENNGKNAASFNSGSVPSPRAMLRAQSGGRAPEDT